MGVAASLAHRVHGEPTESTENVEECIFCHACGQRFSVEEVMYVETAPPLAAESEDQSGGGQPPGGGGHQAVADGASTSPEGGATTAEGSDQQCCCFCRSTQLEMVSLSKQTHVPVVEAVSVVLERIDECGNFVFRAVPRLDYREGTLTDLMQPSADGSSAHGVVPVASDGSNVAGREDSATSSTRQRPPGSVSFSSQQASVAEFPAGQTVGAGESQVAGAQQGGQPAAGMYSPAAQKLIEGLVAQKYRGTMYSYSLFGEKPVRRQKAMGASDSATSLQSGRNQSPSGKKTPGVFRLTETSLAQALASGNITSGNSINAFADGRLEAASSVSNLKLGPSIGKNQAPKHSASETGYGQSPQSRLRAGKNISGASSEASSGFVFSFHTVSDMHHVSTSQTAVTSGTSLHHVSGQVSGRLMSATISMQESVTHKKPKPKNPVGKLATYDGVSLNVEGSSSNKKANIHKKVEHMISTPDYTNTENDGSRVFRNSRQETAIAPSRRRASRDMMTKLVSGDKVVMVDESGQEIPLYGITASSASNERSAGSNERSASAGKDASSNEAHGACTSGAVKTWSSTSSSGPQQMEHTTSILTSGTDSMSMATKEVSAATEAVPGEVPKSPKFKDAKPEESTSKEKKKKHKRNASGEHQSGQKRDGNEEQKVSHKRVASGEEKKTAAEPLDSSTVDNHVVPVRKSRTMRDFRQSFSQPMVESGSESSSSTRSEKDQVLPMHKSNTEVNIGLTPKARRSLHKREYGSMIGPAAGMSILADDLFNSLDEAPKVRDSQNSDLYADESQDVVTDLPSMVREKNSDEREGERSVVSPSVSNSSMRQLSGNIMYKIYTSDSDGVGHQFSNQPLVTSIGSGGHLGGSSSSGGLNYLSSGNLQKAFRPHLSFGSNLSERSAAERSVGSHDGFTFDGMTEECVICKTNFRRGDEVLGLPCSHVFHFDCCYAWLTRQHTCPICRFALPIDSAEFLKSVGRNDEAEHLVQERERWFDAVIVGEPVHFGISCTLCKKSPLVGNLNYRCEDCENVYLCARCWVDCQKNNAEFHDPSHEFRVFDGFERLSSLEEAPAVVLNLKRNNVAQEIGSPRSITSPRTQRTHSERIDPTAPLLIAARSVSDSPNQAYMGYGITLFARPTVWNCALQLQFNRFVECVSRKLYRLERPGENLVDAIYREAAERRKKKKPDAFQPLFDAAQTYRGQELDIVKDKEKTKIAFLRQKGQLEEICPPVWKGNQRVPVTRAEREQKKGIREQLIAQQNVFHHPGIAYPPINETLERDRKMLSMRITNPELVDSRPRTPQSRPQTTQGNRPEVEGSPVKEDTLPVKGDASPVSSNPSLVINSNGTARVDTAASFNSNGKAKVDKLSCACTPRTKYFAMPFIGSPYRAHLHDVCSYHGNPVNNREEQSILCNFDTPSSHYDCNYSKMLLADQTLAQTRRLKSAMLTQGHLASVADTPSVFGACPPEYILGKIDLDGNPLGNPPKGKLNHQLYRERQWSIFEPKDFERRVEKKIILEKHRDRKLPCDSNLKVNSHLGFRINWEDQAYPTLDKNVFLRYDYYDATDDATPDSGGTNAAGDANPHRELNGSNEKTHSRTLSRANSKNVVAASQRRALSAHGGKSMSARGTISSGSLGYEEWGDSRAVQIVKGYVDTARRTKVRPTTGLVVHSQRSCGGKHTNPMNQRLNRLWRRPSREHSHLHAWTPNPQIAPLRHMHLDLIKEKEGDSQFAERPNITTGFGRGPRLPNLVSGRAIYQNSGVIYDHCA